MPTFTPAEWQVYWTHLHDFIADDRNGLLLDAEVDLDMDGNRIRKPNHVFHLTSGKYRRYFVSLWELFDHKVEFDHCIEMLAHKAVEINEDRHFDTIVTCTPTAAELLHHIQPRVEQQTGQPLIVCEFGHYPWRSSAEVDPHDFHSRNIVILTDVIASGSLVRDLAARVIRSAGDVVAVLCVVATDSSMCSQYCDDLVISIDLKHGIEGCQTHAPVYALTTYCIPDLDATNFAEANIRHIDFGSVYPEILPSTAHEIAPLISEADMFRQFRESGALTFGFFASDKRHSSLGVRIGGLLENCGDMIWDAIKDLIPDDAVTVFTFRKDELRFGRFVESKLTSDTRGGTFIVLKRQYGDSAQLHHSLVGQTPRLRGKYIVLLRASASTSEEMRAVAALLAGEGVTGIRVICLVNRMGPFTLSFVHRIQQLLTGVLISGASATLPISNQRSLAAFDFIPVYNLTDLRTNDLARMHERIDNVISAFAHSVRVEHFKHLAETFHRLLAPHSINTYAFESGEREISTLGPDDPFAAIGGEAQLAATMAEIVDEIVHSRHRDRLMSTLEDKWRPEAFLQIAGYVVADIDYLRLSAYLPIIIVTLRKRLAELRDYRFTLEEEASTTALSDDEDEELRGAIAFTLQLEIHLLFAWGLLAHFDKMGNADIDILAEVLFAKRTGNVWRDHPINLRFHFGDMRVYGLSVFLLHSLLPEFAHSSMTAKRREGIIRNLQLSFEELLTGLEDSSTSPSDEFDSRPSLSGRIKELLDLLLSEFRLHPRREWHERIRYLHRYILRDLQQHNPVFADLARAAEDFRLMLRHPSPTLRVRLPSRVQDALVATITLREVDRVARQLAHYPSEIVAEYLRPRFGHGDDHRFFIHTVAKLSHWLTSRANGPFPTESECFELDHLVQEVQETIFEPRCGLRRALLYFIVPMRLLLFDALVETNKLLASNGFKDVWTEALACYEADEVKLTYDQYVLMDPPLLIQVIRNILFNVRHSLTPGADQIYGEKVRLFLTTREEHLPSHLDTTHFVILRVEAEGRNVSANMKDNKHTTLIDHQARVREFGATLDLRELPGGTGSVAEFKMISREHYRRHINH